MIVVQTASKQADQQVKKGVKRSSTALEIIHSDVYCPNMDAYGQKYFITFRDDYLRYMYLYMLHNKSEALEVFKVFKAEVEKQYEKQIKIVRSDRGSEYYGRYTEDGQVQGPFCKVSSTKWNCCPIYYAWFSGSEWCSRKKKLNIIGHGV